MSFKKFAKKKEKKRGCSPLSPPSLILHISASNTADELHHCRAHFLVIRFANILKKKQQKQKKPIDFIYWFN